MTPEQFAYWLQGFVEITGGGKVTDKQWQIVQDHLKEVFHKVTPNRGINIQPVPMPNLPNWSPQMGINTPTPNYQIPQSIC